MELRPCPACRRHIATAATQCRFCGETLDTSAPNAVLASGRLSRAAVFAGALSSACSQPAAPRPLAPVLATPDASVEVAPPADATMPVDAPPPLGPDVPKDRRGTATLSGRVLRSDGSVVPFIQVFIRSAKATRDVTSDGQGQFLFNSLDVDSYDVSVAPKTNGGYALKKDIRVDLADGQASVQDVVVVALVGTANVAGRVLHNGKPLAGIRVYLMAVGASPNTARLAMTDSKGRYAFDKVLANDYELKIDAPEDNGGYALTQGAMLTVADKKKLTKDLAVIPVPVRAPIPMPYGAPPARRRMV